MKNRPPVVCILGPTATGKTALGVGLARRFGGEIVSCDSMQLYRGLPIGTAQPTAEEQAAAPHHLVGFLDVDQPFSVSDYVARAGQVLAEIRARGRLPLLVGGTGLYARALLRGFDFEEGARDDALRARLVEESARETPEETHRRLAEIDPVAAEEIHPNNRKRVLRALEYCLLTGEPFSRQAERSREREEPYCSLLICPVFEDRQRLYERINTRVDAMMEQGLLAEAEKFFHHCQRTGTPPTAAQAIGYKELFPYFRGEISLPEAIERVKQESRRYAKRQLTWFAREPGVQYLYLDGLRSGQALEQAGEMVQHWLEETNFAGAFSSPPGSGNDGTKKPETKGGVRV